MSETRKKSKIGHPSDAPSSTSPGSLPRLSTLDLHTDVEKSMTSLTGCEGTASSSSTSIAVAGINTSPLPSRQTTNMPSPILSPRPTTTPSLATIDHITAHFALLSPSKQSQVLLNLITKSTKATMQKVSLAIRPSLRVNFLHALPAELSFHVLKYLDLRSLGRCSQVSRGWKFVVQSDAIEYSIWKRRLMLEGWFCQLEYDEAVRQDEEDRRRESREPYSMHELDVFDEMNERKEMKKEEQIETFNTLATPVDLMDTDQSTIIQSTTIDDTTKILSLYALHLPRRTHPSGIFKQIYKTHYRTRQNWLTGRYANLSFPAHELNVVTCLQCDDEKIVSGSDDHTIEIFDINTGDMITRLEGHEGGVWALQYTGNTLVSGSTDRTIKIWDIEDQICTHTFEGHTSTVRCLLILLPKLNPDTMTMQPEVPIFCTGSRDATVRVWLLPDPKQPQRETATDSFLKHILTGHTGSVRAVAGEHNVLISGSYDMIVSVWDLSTGLNKLTLRGHREKVYSVAYCHAIKRCASGSMDATVKVWCTVTGVQLLSLETHSSLVGLLDLSKEFLVSAAADGTLKIWNPITGLCYSTQFGHSAPITCFHFSAQQNKFISGSDGSVKVWELSSFGYPYIEPNLMSPAPYGQNGSGIVPIYGRMMLDLLPGVAGVWRVCISERRVVTAVQKEGAKTWFEVFDFGACESDIGQRILGEGDIYDGDGDADHDDDLDEDHDFDGDELEEGEGDEIDDEELSDGTDMHADDEIDAAMDRDLRWQIDRERGVVPPAAPVLRMLPLPPYNVNMYHQNRLFPDVGAGVAGLGFAPLQLFQGREMVRGGRDESEGGEEMGDEEDEDIDEMML